MNTVNSRDTSTLLFAGAGAVISSIVMVAAMTTSLPGTSAFVWFSLSVIAFGTLSIIVSNLTQAATIRKLAMDSTSERTAAHAA